MFESSLACFNGPIIMIGCGSVGHALLPLLRRHLVCLSSHITIIDPIAISLEIRNEFGLRQIQLHLLNSNYKQVLDELVEKPGFIINLAVNVSSLDLIRWCRDNGFLYIDAGTDPWGDFYFSSSYSNAVRTNYYLREQLRGEQRSQDNSAPTAVSCCGANPGMVSWLLNRPLKYPTQKCGALLGTFDFHATLSYRELPALFEADFIGLSLVFPHFPRLTLSADGFAPACACA